MPTIILELWRVTPSKLSFPEVSRGQAKTPTGPRAGLLNMGVTTILTGIGKHRYLPVAKLQL